MFSPEKPKEEKVTPERKNKIIIELHQAGQMFTAWGRNDEEIPTINSYIKLFTQEGEEKVPNEKWLEAEKWLRDTMETKQDYN
ncbi:MAG: hypothetical protein QY321_04025 [Patescibacteria group bacterium]|nr:MAG: hypothetical protein QY321_04025 [Patescibacteria group bacterium]